MNKKKAKIALGYWITNDTKANEYFISQLSKRIGDRIHDVHFAHYDPSLIASGRYNRNLKRETTLKFIEDVVGKYNIRLTLLMNYLIEKKYDEIIKIFEEDYYSRGIRSVVVADIELIKRLRDKFPDLYIQGSCLSYRLTEEELEEERQAGVDMHNPSVDIIRNTEQLKRNHELGYKQKILVAEGCLHKCPHEKPVGGHRWSIARGKNFYHRKICSNVVRDDIRYFFKANWVTIPRLNKIIDYIDVIKIPRGTLTISSKVIDEIYPKSDPIDLKIRAIERFLYRLDNNLHHDVMEYNAVTYRPFLVREYGPIPSQYFTDEFFENIEKCNMNCKERGCNICYKIHEKLRRQRELRNYNIDDQRDSLGRYRVR